jgi:transcriptional regulator with XRE-family HTH domain
MLRLARVRHVRSRKSRSDWQIVPFQQLAKARLSCALPLPALAPRRAFSGVHARGLPIRGLASNQPVDGTGENISVPFDLTILHRSSLALERRQADEIIEVSLHGMRLCPTIAKQCPPKALSITLPRRRKAGAAIVSCELAPRQAMIAPRKPDAVDVEVGQRIRIQRLESGLSQTSLAEQLGVSFQQVQKYEKGETRVSAGRLTAIAKILGIPVFTFFGAHDAGTIERSDCGVAFSPLKLLTVPGALQLLRTFAEINDGKMRRSIVNVVENIAAGWR